MDKSMGKLTFKDILEPMRTIGTHRDILKMCLSLTSFNLMVVGDLQEKWIFIIMLHAHLAQDREMMMRRSGWRLRSCMSTIRWASRSAATRVSCTVTGPLHQPAGHKKMWLLYDNYLLNLKQSFLWPTPTQNNTETQILSHRFPASRDTTKLFQDFLCHLVIHLYLF